MLAKPCSSKVRERLAITWSSTARYSGSSSGNPLSGVGLSVISVSARSGQVLQERVAAPLLADGGLLAVAGEHHDVVGQGQHLGGQAVQHRRMVAARQVGAPYGACEQQVAGEHHLGDLVDV